MRNLTKSIVTEKYLVMKFSKKLLNCSDQTWTGVFNFVWLFTFKMYRKELALICILIQEGYVKKFFSKRAFLHILNVYSHNTKLNTPVLVWSLQLSNFLLNFITKTFFSDYWLCKNPYKKISPLYLLHAYNLFIQYISSIPWIVQEQ